MESASLFGKQYWVIGEYQIEVLNLIHMQTNRLGTLEVLFTFHRAFRYINSLLNKWQSWYHDSKTKYEKFCLQEMWQGDLWQLLY